MTAASQPAGDGFDPARLIATHQAGVWRYLRVLGCDPSQADDLTQETFLKVLRTPFQEFSPTATSAYLRRTAHSLFVSACRRSGRTVSLEDLDTVDRAWNEWSGDDQGESRLAALRDCLKQLGDRARLALELRFRDQRTRADIAAALSMTEDGAKNLLQRAKQKLRGCIEGKVE